MESRLYSRASSVEFESNEDRGPISGLFYRFRRPTAPSFTFLEAIQDVLSEGQETIHGMSRGELESVCHTLMGIACEKKRELGEGCPLNEHEIAALYLYTAEFFDGECYYAAVNGLLRGKNRAGIRPFTRIIWLTLLASSKCPPFTRHTLHRGIKVRSAQELRTLEAIYVDGRTVTWGQFSSCSTILSTQNDFLGQSGYRMLFNIEVNHDPSVPNTARIISQMSLMADEEEVILPPNTRVFVVSSYSPTPDMVIVSLRVVPSLDNIFPGEASVFSTSIFIPSDSKGIKTFENGDRYEGDLLDSSLRHGRGTMTCANGDHYEGDWVNDSMTGKGKFTYSNGDCYKGDFTENKKCGIGTLIFANGNQYYEGEWVDNTRTGTGVFQWANGDRYEGSFMENKKHGKGTMSWVDGCQYAGDWMHNSITGEGVYTWSNGDCYQGDWVDNARTGMGVFTWANGDIYTGHFKGNLKHGQGELRSSNGKLTRGMWNNDEFVVTT